MLESLSPTLERAFLGVERSATGRRWRSRLDVGGQETALAMAQAHGLPDVIARVLAGRGVVPDDVPSFMEPRLRDLLPEPLTLTDMDGAVERLAAAVRLREKIAIFGDYDVDGACSSALLASYLAGCGIAHAIHIPDRITEGYGPNLEAIRTLAAGGARLLVTVDCGTASHAAIEEARRLGLDTIVLDHHQAPEKLPAAYALVNPNRLDDLSGLGHLCAAGVVFVTLVALNRHLRQQGFWSADRPEPDLMASLDLVALATVADVVPLKGLNRAFVRQGLAVMRRRERIGLRALMDVARLDGPPAPYHLGFLLGPRINAGGRIGDAALGARLLLLEDEIEAGRIAVELDRLNQERQAIEKLAVEEADALAAVRAGGPIVVSSQDWHPGVLGLVAARLKERYRLPVFALSSGLDPDLLTGSGRSIVGVDLGRAVRAAVEGGLAIKGGGHAMAAGITIESGRLEVFAAWLAEYLSQEIAAAQADESLVLDGALTASGTTSALVAQLEKAGPFGSGHPEPVFALAHHSVQEAAEVGNGHVRVRLKAGDGTSVAAIAFRAAAEPLGRFLLEARGRAIHAAGMLSLDRWGGAERVQMRLIDAGTIDR